MVVDPVEGERIEIRLSIAYVCLYFAVERAGSAKPGVSSFANRIPVLIRASGNTERRSDVRTPCFDAGAKVFYSRAPNGAIDTIVQ